MKLSIIIPAYNTPVDLFDRCIQSIDDNIVDDVEVLIIDDGSKVEFSNHIDELVEKREMYRVIHQTNKGEGGARNTGIVNSSGDYMMFVDSDDFLAPGWIPYALELVNRTNADIVIGRMRGCGLNNREFGESYEISSREFAAEDIKIIQKEQFLERTDILPNLPYIDYGVCAKIYKREIIDGALFPEGVVLSVDQVYNHQIIRKSKKIVVTNKMAYNYVVNTESVSHKYQKDAVTVMMTAMEKIKTDYMLDDDGVRQAFYYHAMRDLQRALAFSVFSDPNASFIGKVKMVRSALERKFVKKCRKHVNLNLYNGLRDKALGFMLKYKLANIYCFVWTMRGWIKK